MFPAFLVFEVIFWAVIIIAIISSVAARKRKRMVSDDGHKVKIKEDLTCTTKYGHDHPESGHQYIVHEEPEEGYVVLNGVKRKLKDCAKL